MRWHEMAQRSVGFSRIPLNNICDSRLFEISGGASLPLRSKTNRETENKMLNHVKSANRNEQSYPIRSDPDFVNAALFTSLKVILGFQGHFRNHSKSFWAMFYAF